MNTIEQSKIELAEPINNLYDFITSLGIDVLRVSKLIDEASLKMVEFINKQAINDNASINYLFDMKFKNVLSPINIKSNIILPKINMMPKIGFNFDKLQEQQKQTEQINT